MKTLIICLINFCILTSFKSVDNQILVRGHHLADNIEDAAVFYAEVLGLENMTILIYFSPLLPKDMNGYTLYEEKPEYNSKTALIRINSTQHLSGILITLAHEMVHVHQFSLGNLVHHANNHYSWKGKNYYNITNIDYQARLWEKEALNLERDLFERYLKSAKNMTFLAINE